MIYIKRSMTKEEFDDLYNKYQTDERVINDFAFEYLYDKGYIKTDKQFSGAILRNVDDQCELICATVPEKVENYAWSG